MTVIEMIWNTKGWGYLPATELCKKDFWTEYRELDQTPVGKVLTHIRADLVNRYSTEHSSCVDVGIGGGAFVELMNCHGVDIDPNAMVWLQAHGYLWNGKDTAVMTFWDSMEHIKLPGELIKWATELVFISTPIYEDFNHCIRSKHFKPGEHLWYFTDRGLKIFMAERGFALLEQNRMEENVGREDIGTYVFQRI